MRPLTLALTLAALTACDDGPDATPADATPADAHTPDAAPPPLPDAPVAYTAPRAPCATRNPLRDAYFGDLHVHTGFSFDAHAYGNPLTPADAYRFARGEPVTLAGGRTARIDRPLHFTAVTDHGDLLGEVALCTTPGTPAYDTPRCQAYRDPDGGGAYDFGLFMASLAPARDEAICGPADADCHDAAAARWAEMIAAAEAADDKTEACAFTAFVGYEYTNTRGVSNLHRNVVFRNADVPARPIGYFEAPRPLDLWQQLTTQCLDAAPCDVLVLPHNSNLSNGRLFRPDYPDAATPEAEREIAELRSRLEPIVEIFQHKGDSECRNGFPGIPDEARCDFEKLRAATDPVCPDAAPGAGGMRLLGCVHRLDFVRNVLLEGLREGARIGHNPYRLGFIGSTDTHNGTPGHVAPHDFPGHVGIADDTPHDRLGQGNATHDGVINNPGGLAAVWAVENSRDAIFEAIRRRETYATSGPRIRLRFFAGHGFADDMCQDPHALRRAYTHGVPMGSALASADDITFYLEAHADDGGVATPLAGVEVIKGWLEADGTLHQRVYPALGDPEAGADFDPATCTGATGGHPTLCGTWRDPDAAATAGRPTFYYARALELPTCRWSAHACDALAPADRPQSCATTPRALRQRAWSSPIWLD